jgi:hypothetical protein
VKKFWQELLKWENKNRRCTMPFGTKEFMKLMNRFLCLVFASIIFSRSSSVRRALTVRPVMLLLVFFLVLQNRTIGFEINSL